MVTNLDIDHLNERIVVILTFGERAFELLLDEVCHCVFRHQVDLLHLPGFCTILTLCIIMHNQ